MAPVTTLQESIQNNAVGIQRLPWREYAGSSQNENTGMKALTGWQLLAGLGILGLVAGIPGLCILFLSKDFTPVDRSQWWATWTLIIGASGAVTFLGIFMHLRGRPKANAEYPDLLGTIFPHVHIMQSGAAQLACFAFQHGDYCRIVTLIQNRYDGASKFTFAFKGDIESTLSTTLPAAGVVLAWQDHDATKAAQLRLTFSVEANPAGRLVRPIERGLLNRTAAGKIAKVLSAAQHGAVGGAIQGFANPINAPASNLGRVVFGNLAGALAVDLSSGTKPLPAKSLTTKWAGKPLWLPEKRAESNAAASQIADVLGNLELKYELPGAKRR